MTDTELKRRWFRFSLRSLFAVVAVIGVWLGFHVRTIQHRKQMLFVLEASCGKFSPYNTFADQDKLVFIDGLVATPDKPQVSTIRRILGDRSVPLICLPPSMTSDDLANYKTTFPEAYVTQYQHDAKYFGTIRMLQGHSFEIRGPDSSLTVE